MNIQNERENNSTKRKNIINYEQFSQHKLEIVMTFYSRVELCMPCALAKFKS